LGSGHVQIAVSTEVPHGELGKEFVGVGPRIGFLPKPLVQRPLELLIKLPAHVAGKAVIADTMRELMQANIAPVITVLVELEQILFATGGESAAHTTGAL